MAIHTDLQIYKSAYELFRVVNTLIKEFPRSIKSLLGAAILEACLRIVILISKANAARDKTPHLDELLEKNQEAELLIRAAKDMKFISLKQYADVILLTNSIGKQANGWRKASLSPAT